MTGVAEEGTGGEATAGAGPRPGRRPLNPLKPEVFRNRPHKLALVRHLRSLIDAADLASKNVAPGAAMSASTLSKNLSGDRLPQRSTVEAIVQLCGASDEVRSLSLRLHTAALGEVHPAFAERLAMADAYEETVLLHDRVQARLEEVIGEHRRRQAAYDDLLVRHEATGQALTAAEDELRTRQHDHQQETARLNALLQEEQEARRRDRTAFDARLDRARADSAEQLRARETKEARLGQDLLAQENEIQIVRGLLEDSAAEATALRQERDRLRVESARLREDLVSLQAELAAAGAGQDEHVEDLPLAPAQQAVGRVLDRHPAPREDGEETGRPPVARDATQADGGAGIPVAAHPKPQLRDRVDRLQLASRGAFVVGVVLFGIGLFQYTGPVLEARLTAAGGWFVGSGALVLFVGFILKAVRDARYCSVDPTDYAYMYDL
ncbi:hypothetical protein OG753_40055 [Streptomyces sp. NBC_00029]|uniref:hypothetical protein n=1 Tax=Streptomyces sp. NBC_00029 TaxID=2903613 RepID=UPI003243E334